jgi:large subunit ribosomal protein L18
MAKNAIFTVKFRRKREGKTHYKKRLELLKSEKVRLVIRKSNTTVSIQFVKYQPDGDKVLLTFNSKKLDSYGWGFSKKSIPACYLAGFAAGKLALKKNVSEAILDLGLQTPLKGSSLYAALKGVVDAGVNIPCSPNIFPSDERITGQHIANVGDLASTYTAYQKAKLDIKKLPEFFEATKKKIGA